MIGHFRLELVELHEVTPMLSNPTDWLEADANDRTLTGISGSLGFCK